MANQTRNGKAFEFALIDEANNVLAAQAIRTSVQADLAYTTAQSCFNAIAIPQQVRFRRAANATIQHLIQLEPRLTHEQTAQDTLKLSLQSDRAGQLGDVRDILFSRPVQNWQFGISAKNNHMAVKHSRLSDLIDFGQDWVGVPCSQTYFTSVVPLFHQLRALKGTLWRNVPNKNSTYYVPVLNAFAVELLALSAANPNIPQNLASYLIGRNDFYKVIRRPNAVEIYGFNNNGTLNRSRPGAGGRSAINVSVLRLPTQIIQLTIKPGSSTTSLLVCDQGWQMSFRIHSADDEVAPSLKFDVNLIGHPQSMYANHIVY